MEDTGRFGIPMTIFWLLAIWVVLVLAALVWGIENAESQLRTETRRVLSQSEISQSERDLAFDVAGRDVTLFGVVSSEGEALALAASVDAIPGVRGVRSALTIIEPEPQELVPPVISMRMIGDAVSIRGLVPDADVSEALLAAAIKQYGEDRIVNALVVAENVESRPWLSRVGPTFQYLGELRSGGFVAEEGGFTLNGEVISETVRDRIEQDVELVFDGTLPIISNLAIAVLPIPTFHAQSSGGVVTLQGTVPDQETASGIVDATRRLHEGATIINNLRVVEVAGPAWLDAIGGLLDVARRLDPWTVDISDGVVTITGLTMDEDFLAAISVLTEEVVEGQLTVTTDVQLNPAAVANELTELLAGSSMFENDATTLSTEGRQLLNQAVDILEANPLANLVVEGHTDDQGSEDDNLALSQRQADAVLAYLVAGGIDSGRLSAVGYGESHPIADNVTEAGRAQNRRIVFVPEGFVPEGEG